MTEKQDLVRRNRNVHAFRPEARLGVEPEVTTVVVNHAEHRQLPSLLEAHPALHVAAPVLGVLLVHDGLQRQVVLLVPVDGRADERIEAGVAHEAEVGRRHGTDQQTQGGQLAVAGLQGIGDVRIVLYVVGVHVADLRVVVITHVRPLNLLLHPVEVAGLLLVASRKLRGLRPFRTTHQGLDDAVALVGELVDNPLPKLHGGSTAHRPDQVEAALLRRRGDELPAVVLRHPGQDAFERLDDVL
mmetsp:Transcript_38635/g.115397  ORF Transcript_38635/g.115397 Transcript_38635/m.115397 type:complete len:243 (+) Transcript_38635:2692-3420(+)